MAGLSHIASGEDVRLKSDIITNHRDKKERRVGGFIRWASEVSPGLPLPRLEAITASGLG